MLPLSKNSLGPVPTVKQMELLKTMAEPGLTVCKWTGSSINSHGAFLRWADATKEVNGETVPFHRTESANEGTVDKFIEWHWLEATKLDWRGNTYKISATGLKRIEMGKTRK